MPVMRGLALLFLVFFVENAAVQVNPCPNQGGSRALPTIHHPPQTTTMKPIVKVNPCPTQGGPRALPTIHHPPQTSTMKPEPRACPFGWTPFETHCYRFFHQRQKWATAEKFCQAYAANLASVPTRAHNNFLLSLVPRNSRAWIGGSDGEAEGWWVWRDRSPFNYANWCFREPNNLRRSEHCLEINWTKRHCWNDESCNTNMGFICAQTR